MSWTKFQLFIILALVISGTFNTLSTKWADRIEAAGADGTVRHFNHPFFQTVIMFSGEMLCLLVFRMLFYYYKYKDNTEDQRQIIRGNRSFSIWIFLIPSICDITATSLMYLGLTLTFASSFQMLRGGSNMFELLLNWLDFELIMLLSYDRYGQNPDWLNNLNDMANWLLNFF